MRCALPHLGALYKDELLWDLGAPRAACEVRAPYNLVGMWQVELQAAFMTRPCIVADC